MNVFSSQLAPGRFAVVAGLAALGAAALLSLAWVIPGAFVPFSVPEFVTGTGADVTAPWREHLVRLLGAIAIGLVVTGVHRRFRAERPPTAAMDQAQVLLCLAGALMMMLIGGSLAHAFGVAGAASIVRFRTPIDDPKDITVLFVVMGLGMATGLGVFSLAGLGALCLCALLPVLGWLGEPRQRAAVVGVVGNGTQPPTDHVERVLRDRGLAFELRELVHGTETSASYLVRLGSEDSLDAISRALMAGDAPVRQVSWSMPKRSVA